MACLGCQEKGLEKLQIDLVARSDESNAGRPAVPAGAGRPAAG